MKKLAIITATLILSTCAKENATRDAHVAEQAETLRVTISSPQPVHSIPVSSFDDFLSSFPEITFLSEVYANCRGQPLISQDVEAYLHWSGPEAYDSAKERMAAYEEALKRKGDTRNKGEGAPPTGGDQNAGQQMLGDSDYVPDEIRGFFPIGKISTGQYYALLLLKYSGRDMLLFGSDWDEDMDARIFTLSLQGVLIDDEQLTAEHLEGGHRDISKTVVMTIVVDSESSLHTAWRDPQTGETTLRSTCEIDKNGNIEQTFTGTGPPNNGR